MGAMVGEGVVVVYVSLTPALSQREREHGCRGRGDTGAMVGEGGPLTVPSPIGRGWPKAG